MNIVNSKSLIKYNTFKINVKSDYFVGVRSVNEISEILDDDFFKKQKIMVIGGGSNILFTRNFNGLIIHNKITGIQVLSDKKNELIIEVGAGEEWDNLVEWTTKRNLYGIENLSLIPGSVGAAPIQNIGAYGVEIKDVFIGLSAVNLETGKLEYFNKSKCKFGYRNSVFKNKLKNKYIITSVVIKISKNQKLTLDYKDLRFLSKKNTKNLTSEIIRREVIKIRNSKLPNPKNIGNAGSFFKNPVISKTIFEKIQKKYPNVPYYLEKKLFKIPAGWLIDKVGIKKNSNNSCSLYNKHSLIIINNGDASGIEIAKFSKIIKSEVFLKFNINLEEEVLII